MTSQAPAPQTTPLQTVSIIGLGGLGLLFGSQLVHGLGAGRVRVVADAQRISQYRAAGFYVDGREIAFDYHSPQTTPSSADLVLVCVKFHQLEQVLELIESQLGAHTLIVSALNGISSEAVLARHFGQQRLVYAVAQEMDAQRSGNRLIYRDKGQLVIGTMTDDPAEAQRVAQVADLLRRASLPHSVVEDMPRRLWGKWMLNVGVNQVVAFYQGDFSTIQREGQPREMFKAAMREVLSLAPHEDINLSEADFDYWLAVLDALAPSGKPSLAQDLEAGRKTELELFSGQVLELGQKHGVATPINAQLYSGLRQLEAEALAKA